MPTQTTDKKSSDIGPIVRPADQKRRRDVAVKELERKGRFRMRAFSYAAASIVLVVIWAVSEYNNAGGWPTDGFSQSSSIPHVWNVWIVYPLVGLVLALALDAWNTYGTKQISESEIRREMDRVAGRHAQDHQTNSEDSR